MKAGCGTSLVGSALQTQGAQVQSLLEELRSGMLWDWPKKKAGCAVHHKGTTVCVNEVNLICLYSSGDRIHCIHV